MGLHFSDKEFNTRKVKVIDSMKEQNIDVFLSNHPGRDGTRDKLKALTDRKDNQAHPFIQGEDVVVEAFELLENYTRAQWMQIEENRAQ